MVRGCALSRLMKISTFIRRVALFVSLAAGPLARAYTVTDNQKSALNSDFLNSAWESEDVYTADDAAYLYWNGVFNGFNLAASMVFDYSDSATLSWQMRYDAGIYRAIAATFGEDDAERWEWIGRAAALNGAANEVDEDLFSP